MSAKLKEFQIRRLFLPKFSQLKNIDEAVEELKKGLFNDGLEAIFWNIGNLNNNQRWLVNDQDALKARLCFDVHNQVAPCLSVIRNDQEVVKQTQAPRAFYATPTLFYRLH